MTIVFTAIALVLFALAAFGFAAGLFFAFLPVLRGVH